MVDWATLRPLVAEGFGKAIHSCSGVQMMGSSSYLEAVYQEQTLEMGCFASFVYSKVNVWKILNMLMLVHVLFCLALTFQMQQNNLLSAYSKHVKEAECFHL